jgi:putative tricarboxylic transport membrane protein
VSGASLAVAGLILLSSTALSRSKAGEGAGGNQERLPKWSLKKAVHPLLTLLILFAYIILLEPLGFVLTSFVCLLALFKLSEPKKWLMPLVLSAATAVLSYLLFSVWLQCQLPKGLLRFW